MYTALMDKGTKNEEKELEELTKKEAIKAGKKERKKHTQAYQRVSQK